MVAENRFARWPPKRYNLQIQHQLNFLDRLAGLSNYRGNDKQCPFQAGRFVPRQKQPKREAPRRENAEEGEPLMGDEMEPEPGMGEMEGEESEEGDEVGSEAVGVTVSEPVGEPVVEVVGEAVDEEERDDGESRIRKHIHPCVCDLSRSQRKRIKKHLDKKALMQRKYEDRITEIEEELARLEEERLEREREMEEQQELFGDEYELVGSKKKRKKRSARRASMVSLGVKQVINWRKEPKIKVKLNKASNLRKDNSAYCGRRPFPQTPIKQVIYGEKPNVRETRAFSLRRRSNQKKIKYLKDHEDKKPRFDIPYYV